MRTSTVLGRNWELMLRLYENIAISQVTKENTNVVSRAVSKAFDKVWHSGLKYKLSITEIPELIIKILASYITNRTAQLKIGNHIGPKFELLSGVPQGGILSPTLYIFYVKDIPTPRRQYTWYSICRWCYADRNEYRWRSRGTIAVQKELEIRRINEFWAPVENKNEHW